MCAPIPVNQLGFMAMTRGSLRLRALWTCCASTRGSSFGWRILVTAWPKEDIPEEDRIFMRIHLATFRCAKDQAPPPGVFRNHKGGMSVDWEKYATAEMTQAG